MVLLHRSYAIGVIVMTAGAYCSRSEILEYCIRSNRDSGQDNGIRSNAHICIVNIDNMNGNNTCTQWMHWKYIVNTKLQFKEYIVHRG